MPPEPGFPPRSSRASPGLLVDLLNGDRRTWGGWWTLRDRAGRVTGHFVAFLHRAATTPTAALDRAVTRTAALTRGRFQVGWIDPVEPGTLRPPGASFPAPLARFLQTLSPGQPVTAFEGRPLVLHLAANGSVLFGLARQAPGAAASYRSWRVRLAVGALAALALGWLYSPLRSLRTRLILQFLVGGGLPLAVFLATVLIDRDNREHLLVEQFKEAHLESLMRLDQDLSSEYAPLLHRYRQALAALADAPLTEAPRLLRPLAAYARRQRHLVSQLALTDQEGNPAFYLGEESGPAGPLSEAPLDRQRGNRGRPVPRLAREPGGRPPHQAQGEAPEVIRLLAGNILRSCNGRFERPSGSTGDTMAGIVAETHKPYEWFSQRGRLQKNQVGPNAMFTYFDLLPQRPPPAATADAPAAPAGRGAAGTADASGFSSTPIPASPAVPASASAPPAGPPEVGAAAPDPFRAILFCVHQARIGQIRYLRRLMREWPARSPDAVRLAALPIIPGGQWPAHPRRAAGLDHTLRRLRDLAASTGLPQHEVARVGRETWLVSAVRGTLLDGYVLMLARPYRTIQGATRKLTVQAGFLAALMLMFAGAVAAVTSGFLLTPITGLQRGLEALRRREFRHQVVPGRLAELATVADRFNQVMTRLEELQVARSVQEALWPREGLAGPGWRLAGACRTAADLGGDHHDWFLRPDGTVVLAIGDVAGHGIAAALVGASAKALLAMTAPLADPAAILAAMNQGLLDQTGRAKPMSLWVGLFDPGRRTVRYACAGHNYPLAVMASGETVSAGVPGYPLGTRRNARYQGSTLEFPAGGRLYLYTDGLIEAHNAAAEPFGYDRFAQAARDLRARPPEEAIRDLLRRCEDWAGRAPPEDDQTLVLLDVGGNA